MLQKQRCMIVSTWQILSRPEWRVPHASLVIITLLSTGFHVVNTNLSCRDDNVVTEEGDFFNKYFLRICKWFSHMISSPLKQSVAVSKNKGRTPSAPKRSFNSTQEMLNEDLIEYPINHFQAIKCQCYSHPDQSLHYLTVST